MSVANFRGMMKRALSAAAFGLFLSSSPAPAAEPRASAGGECGEVITVGTQVNTTIRYALAKPRALQGAPIALVLLPGGGGHLDLDENGCPRALKGNSLVRSARLFNEAGFVTALVDAPSSHTGDEGLGAYRITAQHAGDLGRVVADVRARTRGAVWIVGTSRGAISAVNAASRLSGGAAPDGVVLTSPVTIGSAGGRRAWVAHTVFDLPLQAIEQPVLVVGHAADACARSPAGAIGRIVEATAGAREQAVIVTGGPGGAVLPDSSACSGRTSHGFIDQEAEVAAGIGRFIRGGRY